MLIREEVINTSTSRVLIREGDVVGPLQVQVVVPGSGELERVNDALAALPTERTAAEVYPPSNKAPLVSVTDWGNF